MPSIPQSLLWISLVVLWLFVLVPMLISKRDAVRRTSDVALATRVLNSGGRSRLLRRSGPASGHASDPHWRPSEEDLDDEDDRDDDDEPATDRHMVIAQTEREDENGELTLDFDEPAEELVEEPVEAVEEPIEEPVAETVAQTPVVLEAVAAVDEFDDDLEPEGEAEPDGSDDEYEYAGESSDLDAPSEPDLELVDSLSAQRRHRSESAHSAAVSLRKFNFRKRMVTVLVALTLASAASAFLVSPTLWWACGAIGGVTVLYLGYLRRQTRIEERMRRRRAQRMARSRLGVENTDDREFDVVPARLRRPGAVVLEIDDEDPIFEHLDYAPFARQFDLPHAAGQ